MPTELLIVLYVLVFAGLIFLIAIRPQRRRKRAMQEMMSGIQQGADIVTTGGIYGTVTEVEDGETVLLEVAEDLDIRIAKSSIARVVSREDSAAPEHAEAG